MSRLPEDKLPEDQFKDVIAELRRTQPEPPPVHWGAFRAELREKLERRGGRGWAGWSWRLRPFQMAVAASFVAVLVYIGLPGNGHNGTTAMDNARVQWNVDDIVKNRPALSRWHPAFEVEFAEYIRSETKDA
jgi:hypothetical protein